MYSLKKLTPALKVCKFNHFLFVLQNNNKGFTKITITRDLQKFGKGKGNPCLVGPKTLFLERTLGPN